MRLRAQSWAPLLLLPLAVPSTSAAYVQFKDCDQDIQNQTNTPPTFDIQGLRASIVHNEHNYTQLELQLFVVHPRWTTCEDTIPDEVTSSVQMTSRGGFNDQYQGELITQTCALNRSEPVNCFHFTYNIPRPYPLASYLLTVRLEGSDDIVSACVNAPLTPDIGHHLRGAWTWIPVVILLFVILAALWQEASSVSAGDDDSDDSPNEQPPQRTHITRVADCISFLQFIFFASCLSLHFPGFLQPVASRVSWSTLMFPSGLVAQDTWYDGVSDGIYVVNGTFGGTSGMELMTQIMGATVSERSWLNMVTLSALVLMLLAGIVMLGKNLTWSRDWFKGTQYLILNNSAESDLKVTVWTVLRLFCSYFLLPLVAWSTYQLTLVLWLPIYHTVASVVVICSLVLLIWWAMLQSNPRNVGYLLVNQAKEFYDSPFYSPVKEDIYAASTFLLIFLRGSMIGGLQRFGQVQLPMLILLEVAQVMMYVTIWRRPPFWTRGGYMSCIKVALLVLQTAFLPGAASHNYRMTIGYIIVAIYSLVLLGVFIIPSLYNIGCLARNYIVNVRAGDSQHRSENNAPQIYSLRQLMRRPTNLTIGSFSEADGSMHPTSAVSSGTASSHGSHGSHGSFSPSDNQMSFFREPRASSVRDTFSQRSNSTRTKDTISSIPEQFCMRSQDTRQITTSSFSEASGHDCNGSTSPCETISEAGSGDCLAFSPQDPGVDYSVREADLYYIRPRKLSFHAEESTKEQKKSIIKKLSSVWRSSSL